jgi:hypothetical protein
LKRIFRQHRKTLLGQGILPAPGVFSRTAN